MAVRLSPRGRVWVSVAAAAVAAVPAGFITWKLTEDESPGEPVSTVDAPLLGQLPRVDLIDEAVAAVRADRGATPAFFEINATPLVVNLFVRGDDGSVQPYVYDLEGQLSSQAPVPDAQGATFDAATVAIDPATIFQGVVSELPNSSIEMFVILGNAAGQVQYSVLTVSTGGGQLAIVVDGDGTVLSVDPGDPAES